MASTKPAVFTVQNATFAMDAALKAAVGKPKVWLDIGTSYKTLSKWDVLKNESLIVVGVDPVPTNIESPQHPRTPRFVRVQGACTEGPPGFVTFNLHKSLTCGTLLPTRADAPKMGKGSNTCTGDTPVPTRVPSFPLRQLLRKMEHTLSRRIELLKIDVQGSELACLRSAGDALRRVDNLLLEVQDTEETSGKLMYAGSPTMAQLDALLLEHGLRRQYCEGNRWAEEAREVNCLYSSSLPAATKLWATANEQPSSSIVSYGQLPTSFVRPIRIVRHLRTSADHGARVALSSTPTCNKPPCLRNLSSVFRVRRPQ